MKRGLIYLMCLLTLVACNRYEGESGQQRNIQDGDEQQISGTTEETETTARELTEEEIWEAAKAERTPVKVKGIYLTSAVAADEQWMDNIIAKIDETEINAVVIDIKDDHGRITFNTNTPLINEAGSSNNKIEDIKALTRKLKEHNIYAIARVATFRDPYLAEAKPEWSLRDADGSVHKDNTGMAWLNPYNEEMWEYFVELGKAIADAGFDEIQFDYIRFATDKTMANVVYDETQVNGRSKTDIITEFIDYVYKELAGEGIFVSADVFGAIIGSVRDAQSVGQIYEEMAENLDYICPMIYPSHYGEGNFGIEHPDKQPYDTIKAALQGSKKVLAAAARGEKKDYNITSGSAQSEPTTTQATTEFMEDEVLEAAGLTSMPSGSGPEAESDESVGDEPGENPDYHQAVVRPWLQDFTASYLKNYINYGPDEIRAQIQAVYDVGYDEWILWNAACNYTWDGLEPAPEE